MFFRNEWAMPSVGLSSESMKAFFSDLVQTVKDANRLFIRLTR
jgi:hypothetical protein